MVSIVVTGVLMATRHQLDDSRHSSAPNDLAYRATFDGRVSCAIPDPSCCNPMLLLSLLTHVLLGFAELCCCATGLSSRLYGQTLQARHPTDSSKIVSHFLLVCFLFGAAHIMPYVPVSWLSLWSVGFGRALRLCMAFYCDQQQVGVCSR